MAVAKGLYDDMGTSLFPREYDNFTFKDVHYRVSAMGGKIMDVLKGITGTVPAQTFSVVLGPSGAGKSSLFDVLLGVAEGVVFRGYLPMHDRVSYITQEITLVNSETVLDTMWFYANLTLPCHWTYAQKSAKIEDTLEVMDMVSVKDVVVGGLDMTNAIHLRGLSSGQQRRLQVATQLMQSPSVVILDEPTTGLDTTNALHVIQVIHSMCKSRDMIAIASLHQPRREIFLEIDHMMLLAHGRAVYCGPSREMVPFIETFHRPIESQENPADFAIDFLFKLKDEQAEQLANANEKMQGPVPMEGTISFVDYNMHISQTMDEVVTSVPMWDRITVLRNRSWRQLMSSIAPNNALFRINNSIVGGITTAIFCIGVSKTQQVSVQYFIGIQVIAILLQLRYANVALQAFHTTRAMWYKERNHRLYLGFDAFVAQLFNEMCLSVIIACLLYLSLWAPVGWGYFEPGRLLKALVLSCCLQQAMRGLMVYLALVSRDIPGVIVQLMHVFGGCLKKYKNVPKTYRWICFINPYFWGFNGLIQIEYAGFNGIKCPPEVVAADLCITGDQILQSYGFDSFTVETTMIMLLVLAAVYTILSYYAMVSNDQSKMLVLEFSHSSPEDENVKHSLPSKAGDKDAELKDEKRPLKGNSDVAAALSMTPRGSNTLMATYNSSVSPVPQYLQYVNVVYKVPINDSSEFKTILNGLTFSIKRDTMIAIMGPSGSGKTSITRILGGWHLPGITQCEYQTVVPIRELGYVTEDDRMPVTESVYEVLMLYAQCLLPYDMSMMEKRIRVANVMELLHITHLRDTFVGGYLSQGVMLRGVSGGQKRRLSIACSMLNNPRILVMDEPTSGLDATIALDVMSLLRQLNETGRTIICTIHQPRQDIYTLFHYVLFIAQGELVYHGPPGQVVDVFHQSTINRLSMHENPADFVLDQLKGLKRDEIQELMRNIPHNLGPQVPEELSYSKLPKFNEGDGDSDNEDWQMPLLQEFTHTKEPVKKMTAKDKLANHWRRIKLLMGRQMVMLGRNLEMGLCRFVYVGITSLVFVSAYANIDHNHLRLSQITDREGLVLVYMLSGLSVNASTIFYIFGHRDLWMHEINLGLYKAWELFVALNIIHILFFAQIQSAVEFFLVWSIAGYRSGMGYWLFGWFNFWQLLIYSEVAAVIFGLTFADVGSAVGSYFVVLLSYFFPSCGMLVSVHQIRYPMKVLCYCHPMFYACAAELINMLQGRPIIQDTLVSITYVSEGVEVIRAYGYDFLGDGHGGGSKAKNCLMVIAFWIGLALVGWRAFSNKVRKLRKGQGYQ